MPFMTSGQETEWALFLQPQSPHRAGGNRNSYMLCQLTQQWMTLTDLKWPFHASRIISAIAELLVFQA